MNRAKQRKAAKYLAKLVGTPEEHAALAMVKNAPTRKKLLARARR